MYTVMEMCFITKLSVSEILFSYKWLPFFLLFQNKKFMSAFDSPANYFVLNNGSRFPKITFGVSHMEAFENVYKAVDHALDTGYRSFDCSSQLMGEENFGKALEELLPKYNLKRRDIKISSKIHPKDYGTDSTSEAFWRSCYNLRTDYIDLFLMQWPGGHNLDPENMKNQYLREETWKEIEKLNSEGVVRSTGVCHFSFRHLEHIKNFSNQLPAVNQVEFHPKCPQVELLQYCKENNILLQAIGFEETFHPLMLNEEVVKTVARRAKKTRTQVLLKWIINKGAAVISHSENARKIRKNFLLNFYLDKASEDALDSIDIREKYLRNPICVT